jgi:hypothetical protein
MNAADPAQPFTTREAALCLLFDLIRRNAGIDSRKLRIVAELAELPARTRAAIEPKAGETRAGSSVGGNRFGRSMPSRSSM